MKRRYGSIIAMILTILTLSACGNITDREEKKVPDISASSEEKLGAEEAPEETGGARMQEMIIDVGGQSFRATLFDNDTVRALEDRLPVTLNMDEMNGNEKFYYLSEGLPTSAQNVGSIRVGDIMLYGSDCLVLFFEDFNTSYSYTRIGHIEDAQRFAEVLTSGNVEVTFRAGA